MPLLLQLKLFKRDIYKNWSIYPNKYIFVSIPSIGVEHFWVDGRHVLHTPSVGAAHICGVYVILILRA